MEIDGTEYCSKCINVRINRYLVSKPFGKTGSHRTWLEAIYSLAKIASKKHQKFTEGKVR